MSKRAPALEHALEEARRAIGSEHDVQRLRDKLGELPPAAPGVTGSAPTAGASVGTKLAIVTVACALLITGAMLLAPRAPTPKPARAPSPPAAVPAAVSVAVPAAAPVSRPDSLSAPRPADAPAAAARPAPPKLVKPRAGRRVEAPLPTPAPVATTPAELELLTRAHDAIEASPQHALGLLAEHARLYPSGNFAQEREALAIDALRKLGRTREARERAQAFVARFPNASNVKHLSRWLDASSKSDHNLQAEPLPTPLGG